MTVIAMPENVPERRRVMVTTKSGWSKEYAFHDEVPTLDSCQWGTTTSWACNLSVGGYVATGTAEDRARGYWLVEEIAKLELVTPSTSGA